MRGLWLGRDKQQQQSLVDHGKGWIIMLWALLDHLCHEVVEDGDLEDITFQDLSVPYLDVSE
jgi:hypothetical protein